jgi:hypothetical protein
MRRIFVSPSNFFAFNSFEGRRERSKGERKLFLCSFPAKFNILIFNVSNAGPDCQSKPRSHLIDGVIWIANFNLAEDLNVKN